MNRTLNKLLDSFIKPNGTSIAENISAWFITKPKIYEGFFTQTGTTAPTGNVLEDGIGAPVWARTAVGTFTLTKTGAFTSGKTVPVDDVYTDQSGNLYKINRTSANVMTLLTYAAADTTVLADGVLNNRFIHIEIRP